MRNSNHPPNCLIVIFGASGDLTKRKLIPALYSLWKNRQTPSEFAVLGISRTEFSDQSFRDMAHDFLPDKYGDDWSEFAKRLYYHAADSAKPDHWAAMQQRIVGLGHEHDTGTNLLFYLALAPRLFEPVIEQIGSSGLVTEGRRYCTIGSDTPPWQRIIVEKPFGSDLKSAQHLNQVLDRVFDEDDIYRIDHYLGKELVQNLLVVRFANALFEPIWNHRYIDHVQITASETVGVEGRGNYYDGPAGGALRDMVQSHLLQVLSLVAMEPPITMDAADVRTEKVKVFKALRVPKPQEVTEIAVRGQYDAGRVNGELIHAYRQGETIDRRSQTDTFAALRFHVDTWRWGDVPFYLRSGKAMAAKKTEIALYFKPTPHALFREHCRETDLNQIVINVQPNEGIRIRFEGKVPGIGLNTRPVVMDFDYEKQWQVSPPDGYATLLNDCLHGDLTNYKHREEVEISWKACQPILDHWAENPQEDLPNYVAGTWGPRASDLMMAKENRHWHNC